MFACGDGLTVPFSLLTRADHGIEYPISANDPKRTSFLRYGSTKLVKLLGAQSWG